MGRKVTLSTCSLAQWALDFEGNLRRILESIRIAKEEGARYRLGPELEISGYGCGDHFLENDSLLHSWESLACVIENPVCENILVDVGMPVSFQHTVYNCRVVLLNKKIVLIRPKKVLTCGGNYHEQRWFSPWTKDFCVEELYLPPIISKITGQVKVPFGDAVIATLDTVIGCEACHELFIPYSTHASMALQGVEIFVNGSGSHHELRRLNQRINMISQVTERIGGVYLYSNITGCDGERLLFDGSCMIVKNGELIGQGKQFFIDEIDVITGTVDLDDIVSHRRNPNIGAQCRTSKTFERVNLDFTLTRSDSLCSPESPVIKPQLSKPEEEIALGPACWLWDYLRRSGCGGFFLPLSGGIDSSSIACIVASMCRLVVTSAKQGSIQTINDIRKVTRDPLYIPNDPKEFCNRIFVTCYMGTSNSSQQTKGRASALANDIGSYHLGVVIDSIIEAIMTVFSYMTGKTPRFRIHGGSDQENLALQNVQARTRMLMSYTLAQLMLWSGGLSGPLLVLGSSNVDECLIGYMTKYDCSSADLNPIGGFSKNDLKKFVFYCVEKFNFTSLIGIIGAQPAAELEPLKDGHAEQIEEKDMGLTYDELSLFGRLRKMQKCGPYTMFTKLLGHWGSIMSPSLIADKVKRFFHTYAVNRHKSTILTPSYHAESYSADDNRFDLRPFLYRSSWPWQFRSIDRAVMAANKTIASSSLGSNKFESVMGSHHSSRGTPPTMVVPPTLYKSVAQSQDDFFETIVLPENELRKRVKLEEEEL